MALDSERQPAVATGAPVLIGFQLLAKCVTWNYVYCHRRANESSVLFGFSPRSKDEVWMLFRLAALGSAKSSESWNCLFSEAAMTSLPPAETAEKSHCWVLKIDVVCLRLFCEIAKMTERSVFDSEKSENNALQSYYIAFKMGLRQCWLVNFLFANMFDLFTSITDEMYSFRTLLLLLFSIQWVSVDFVHLFALCGQGSSLLRTPALRPLHWSNAPAEGEEGNW